MPSCTWLQPGCKVSLLVRSIFYGETADLTSGPHCSKLSEGILGEKIQEQDMPCFMNLFLPMAYGVRENRKGGVALP